MTESERNLESPQGMYKEESIDRKASFIFDALFEEEMVQSSHNTLPRRLGIF